jgi:hypothetical protein
MRRVLYAAMGMHLMATPAWANVLAVIDKTTQTMTVSRNGERLWVWKVSTGRPGYATPSGTFHPTFLSADHISSKYESAPMPWSVFFNGDVAIHGTTEVRRLGRAVSHGCVRLRRAHAAEFFQLVQEEGLGNVTIRVTTSKTAARSASKPRSYRSRRNVTRDPWSGIRPRYRMNDWYWDF